MNIILYLIIFAIGSLCGSFLTLATYRIPLHKDITHEHSFCPNCNHKLSFLDLIPILSYLFLGGKCRYCKKKISIRYFLFEIFTGMSFVALAYILGFNIYKLYPNQILEFFIYATYIVFLLMVAGIDFKNKRIEKSVLIFGITIACINIMYQFIYTTMIGSRYNLNRIILYLVFIIIILIIEIETIRKNTKYDYCFDLILLSVILSLFTYEITTIFSIIGCLIIVFFRAVINKKQKSNKTIKTPVASYLIASHFIVLIISGLYII